MVMQTKTAMATTIVALILAAAAVAVMMTASVAHADEVITPKPAESEEEGVTRQVEESIRNANAITQTLDCNTEYLQIVSRFTVESHIHDLVAPQMDRDEITAVASVLHSYRHFRSLQAASSWKLPSFLVFGLGVDSIMWDLLNCGGRTAFLENYRSWFDTVTQVAPDLEVYMVNYRGSITAAGTEKFQAQPWLMDMPNTVREECWDVILIDAPQGYDEDLPQLPGRLEAIYWSSEQAKRCIAEGKVDQVFIFLHDAGRRTEILGYRAYLQPFSEALGHLGRSPLKGFRFTRESIARASSQA